MSEEINHPRRRFLGVAALAVAAAGITTTASAQASSLAPVSPATGAGTSFKALKRVRAGVLETGYAEAGPASGPAVLLLHGWPYDIHSFADVAPLLATAGYRVIVPYLR
ncbi:alpha/beta fold hydrolase, partial [Rhizobiaceae sp. 2RAB30]